MINLFINQIKNIDKKIINIIKNGIRFSFILCLFSFLILINYSLNPIYINAYYVGLQLFKTSFSFAIEFLVCGFAIDIIKKEIK